MVTFLEQSRNVFESLLPARIPPALLYVSVTAFTLIALALAYGFVYKDYHAFLALGHGGTPSNFKGYLRITWLRCYAHRDCLIPPPLTPDLLPSSGYLLRLPHRPIPRPKVAGIAPHRQLNQRPIRRIHEAMEPALRELADAHPSALRIGTSSFEKYAFALFLNSTAAVQHKGATHLNETCRDTGEICHLHDTVSNPQPISTYRAITFPRFGSGREKDLEEVNSHWTHLVQSGLVTNLPPFPSPTNPPKPSN